MAYFIFKPASEPTRVISGKTYSTKHRKLKNMIYLKITENTDKLDTQSNTFRWWGRPASVDYGETQSKPYFNVIE